MFTEMMMSGSGGGTLTWEYIPIKTWTHGNTLTIPTQKKPIMVAISYSGGNGVFIGARGHDKALVALMDGTHVDNTLSIIFNDDSVVYNWSPSTSADYTITGYIIYD